MELSEFLSVSNAISGAIGGGVVTLLTQWFGGRIVHKNALFERRAARIAYWRSEFLDVEKLMSLNVGGVVMHNTRGMPLSQSLASRIVAHPGYTTLEYDLSSSFRAELDKYLASWNRVTIEERSHSFPMVLSRLSEEIDRIERKWELI